LVELFIATEIVASFDEEFMSVLASVCRWLIGPSEF
jgi:hypothetical protein